MFKDAVQEGTGARIEKLKYNQPDFAMTKQLTLNVGVFSAFKAHSMTSEVVAALRDDKGQMVSFNAFKEKVLSIDSKYNVGWLQTEYESAVRTSRMAREWEGIQRTKHLYPNLEYVISRSTIKREEHLALVGTVLPVDDEFWNKFYPPNGWGCKCSVRKTDKPINQTSERPALAPEFSFNAGKEGIVFNVDESGYGKNMKSDTRKRVLEEASKATFEHEKKDFLKYADSSLVGKSFSINSRKLIVKSVESLIVQSLDYLDKFAIMRNLDKVSKQGKWTPNYYEYKVFDKTVRIQVENVNDEIQFKTIQIL